MKIAIINGCLPQNDFGLGKVVSSIASTLVELGLEIDEINLGYAGLPYYIGVRAQAMDDIYVRLKAASGIVFASCSLLYAPSAMMQVLLEYLEFNDYKDALHEKHCMFAMISKNGGERSAIDHMAHVIGYLGGYESGRIGLQEKHTMSIQDAGSDSEGSVQDFIERETEDFYRAVRQNRKYIMPADIVQAISVSPAYQQTVAPTAPTAPAVYNQASSLQQAYSQPAVAEQPLTDVSNKLNLDAFTDRQEQDIKELTALFSQKYVPPQQQQQSQHIQQNNPTTQHNRTLQQNSMLQQNQLHTIQNNPILQQNQLHTLQHSNNQPDTPPPMVRTVKQLTQNLPHYYQPQMAAGMTAIIQFSITGSETFDGYITIIDNECDYSDGFAENPEITIISDSNTWHDVLKGKHTAQRAFMIGGLKVRGNFVLLTKFDTLFKLG